MLPGSSLIHDIEVLLAAAKSSNLDDLDDATRVGLLGKVESIHHQLDDPVLAMYRHLSNANQTAALGTVLQMGVLKDIPQDGAINVSKLASDTKVDNTLLTRLLRQLSSTGILRSVGENEYAHTKFSLAYIDKSEIDFFNLAMGEIAQIAHRLPEYIASHEAAAIVDAQKSPFSRANDREGKNFYEVLLEQPDRLAKFNSGMMTREAQHRILGLFPLSKLAKNIDKTESERSFIVDIAGGRGQSLLAIQGELRDLNLPQLGKWILQERKGVLDSIPDDELPGIKKMAIDFLEPQPVKAHIYYLRRILHNWHDEPAKVILRNVADAMSPDSTLLIGEMAIPAQAGVNKYVYVMDICMLIIGGKERTETEFSDPLDIAGLRLVKVWTSKSGDQTVIECRLK